MREWSYEEATQVSPEVIERAVRMVSEAGSDYASQWAAITSVAAKIGCTPETLRRWIRQQETDTGQRPGLSCAEQERMKALERENRELRKTAASNPKSVHRQAPLCLRR